MEGVPGPEAWGDGVCDGRLEYINVYEIISIPKISITWSVDDLPFLETTSEM